MPARTLALPEDMLPLIPKGRFVVSDVESNGLLPGMSSDLPPMDKLHCATARDYLTDEHFEWSPDNSPSQSGWAISTYAEWLMDEAGIIGGHNFQTFDHGAIKLVYPKYEPTKFLTLDSLIMCKMIWPADSLIGPDMKMFHAGRLPAKYIKRQSLAAWGCRLGNQKDTEFDAGDWQTWTQEMQTYMVQDESTNVSLFDLIFRRIGWAVQATSVPTVRPSTPSVPVSSTPSSPPESSSAPSGPTTYVWPYKPFWIEHEYALVNAAQENIGVAFDMEKAQALVADLMNQQAAMAGKLRTIFGSWYAPKDDPVKGRVNKKDRTRICHEHPNITKARYGKTGKRLADYVGPPKEVTYAGAPYCRIEYTEFNPNSRTHLGDRLMRVFGWVPNIYNPNGKPQVDEGAIKAIPKGVISEEVRKTLLDYFVVTKTLGQIHDGNKAFMQYVSPTDGAIHGRVDPLGTVSSRGSHFNPNLGQVIAVRKDDAGKVLKGLAGGFGFESRELFRARRQGELSGTTVLTQDWELTGSDKSSLEFIWLGHYLLPLDEGVFSERVCDPKRDAHTEHGELTGLGRAPTKTVGYAYIFGAGKWKIGYEVGVEEHEIPELLKDKGMQATLRWLRKKDPSFEEPSDLDKARIAKGGMVIKKFEGAITGLKFLKEDITASARRGWIKAIDGRKLTIRKPHAALNTLLQGAGAISCKTWIIIFHQKMRAEGFVLGVDYNQVLWVHDEIQVEHRPGLGPTIARLSNEAAKEAGKFLGLRGSLRTEAKTGRNWAETH